MRPAEGRATDAGTGPASGGDAGHESTPGTIPLPFGNRRWPFGAPLLVLLGTLAVTGVLVAVANSAFHRNERRLLRARVQAAGLVLAASPMGIESPLAAAVELADLTGGNARRFRGLVLPQLGPDSAHRFVSVSLWRDSALSAGPVSVVGSPPELTGANLQALLARVAHSGQLEVAGLTSAPSPRLGYAYAPRNSGEYVVYAESQLPPHQQSRLSAKSAFSDLDFALYLGPRVRPRDLMVTSVVHPPLHGRTAQEQVPWGNGVVTLVVSSRVALSGSLLQRLPWIIGGAGIVLALLLGAVTLRLIGHRRDAERMADRLQETAGENRRLYAEQRTIAQTLQHALLPDELPQPNGMEASARYQAGERGVEIGGDWYDLIECDDRRLLMVVGDVTGRGLRAATTMASLRYAIHAYAAENDPPAVILRKLSGLVSVAESGQLATILCALIDVEDHSIVLTSAGHLPPLMLSARGGEYLHCEVGLPIGVERNAEYVSQTLPVPPSATLLAFTDGLVERRGENLDDGLARLRRTAGGIGAVALSELITEVVSRLHDPGSEDDTVILGLRWTN